jgi:NADH-quinone oxidoreductase subunit L
VHVFSTVYLADDNNKIRYFAYLQLFVFAMLAMLISDNLLIIFIFWELVGLASYLLIGFWNTQDTPPRAALKAFLVNKTADIGFLIGLMILYTEFNTLNITELKYLVFNFQHNFIWLQIAGLCLFVGAMGKSAQFPFQTWLPDAMAGPTPVSALIHAATMVAAGVYLLVRVSFIFTLDLDIAITIIGTTTAIYGAVCATSQFDIKRILAYSTISQLGLMVAAVGMGGFEAAFFHLVTHAFFKAGLFLSAGSIIHAMHHNYHNIDIQDIRNMGGLYKKLPFTFSIFLICAIALAGIPLSAGFLSKEMIMNLAFYKIVSFGFNLNTIVFVLLSITGAITVFYVSRMIWLVFIKKPISELTVHENNWLILSPMAILALFSLGFWYGSLDQEAAEYWIITPILENIHYYHHHATVLQVSLFAILIGVILYFLLFKLKATLNNMLKTLKEVFFLNFRYSYMIARSQLMLARVWYYMDTKLIDRTVNYIGIGMVTFAHIVKFFDTFILDGMVHVIPSTLNQISKLLKKLTNGQLQLYLAVALMALMLLMVFIFVL